MSEQTITVSAQKDNIKYTITFPDYSHYGSRFSPFTFYTSMLWTSDYSSFNIGPTWAFNKYMEYDGGERFVCICRKTPYEERKYYMSILKVCLGHILPNEIIWHISQLSAYSL